MLPHPIQIFVRFSFIICCTVFVLSPSFGDSNEPEEPSRITASQLLQKAQSADDCHSFWTDYFVQENVNPDAIKEAVRLLSTEIKTKKENADQIIALIETAMLSGNAQPWMYEALALTLYLKGAPKAQVLRAALSAADFSEHPADTLNIAFVMHRVFGLKEHVFPLYRQAAENMPPRLDLYAAMLRLAEELFDENDDEESLRWIALTILSVEWDGVLGSKLSQEAINLLTMLGNRLTKQNRDEDRYHSYVSRQSVA